jgi:hypothetical protein
LASYSLSIQEKAQWLLAKKHHLPQQALYLQIGVGAQMAANVLRWCSKVVGHSVLIKPVYTKRYMKTVWSLTG